MLKAAIKSLLHHKTRLALTGLSIVLGVAFISGTFIYTDTTSSAFDGIFDTAFEGVDVVVSSDSPFSFGQGVYFDEELVEDVAAVPGVGLATSTLQGMGCQSSARTARLSELPALLNSPPTYRPTPLFGDR